MSNLLQSQTVDWIVSLVRLAAGLTVYTRVSLRLAKTGGGVQAAMFQVPDLLVAILLAMYFGTLLWANLRLRGATETKVTIDQLIGGSMFFVVFTAGVAGYLQIARNMSVLQLFGVRRQSVLKTAGWALALLACGWPLIRVASYLTELTVAKDQLAQQTTVDLFRDLATRGDRLAIAKFLLATVVAAPFCEEVLFRGFFYGVTKRFIGSLPAGFLCSLFFAAFHANLASLAPLFVLAVCFTLAYERTGSLLVPMGMHALFNSLNLVLLYGQIQGWFPTQ